MDEKLERDVATNTTTTTIAYIDDEEHEADDKGLVCISGRIMKSLKLLQREVNKEVLFVLKWR